MAAASYLGSWAAAEALSASMVLNALPRCDNGARTRLQ
jgi:hypothetical protein